MPSETVSAVRVRITRFGWALALMALAVCAAALNTGNNLLYLLLGLVLAAYPVTALAARRAVRSVDGHLLAPAEGRCGEALPLVAELRAGDRRGVPALLVSLVGLTGGGAAVPWIEAGARRPVALPWTPDRRGERRLRLLLRSTFPLGVVEAARLADSADVLVLPRRATDVRRPRTPDGREGTVPSRRAGSGEEILDIREFRPGDDWRRLDWKATARTDVPMVRVHEREQERVAAIVVDPTLPRGRRAAAERAVEREISRAAGAADALQAQGFVLLLETPAGTTRGDLHAVERALARLDLREEAVGPFRPVLEREGALIFRAESAASSRDAERSP
jgi:uncharacterized protein (DUF58 family)